MKRMELLLFYIRLCIGLSFLLGAFVFIVWNEGNSLHVAKSLEFAQNTVISISNAPIDPANNGKLVHITGKTTFDKLTDPVFEASAQAVTLEREVTMYQYTAKYGNENYGSERWVDHPIDLTGSRNKSSWLFTSQVWQVPEIKVGDYYLPSALVSRIPAKPVPIPKARLKQLQVIYHIPMELSENDSIYVGKNSYSPDIGDMKISITVRLPQQVSIIAKQEGNKLTPYPAPSGEDIFMLYPGQLSATELLSTAQLDNILYSWYGRFMAFIVMFSGLKILRTPLEFLAKSSPALGRLFSYSINIAALVVTLILTTSTIVISWLAFRFLFY